MRHHDPTRPGPILACPCTESPLRLFFTVHYVAYMTIRHKHLKLDQRKIDKARRALGTKTEQETGERALDMVLAEERLARVLKRGRRVGGFDDAFRD